MKVNASFRLVTLCACVLAGVSASAHHSISAEFDSTKPVTIKGTVSRIDWVNPHAHFFVEGEDGNGRKGTWDFELLPPARLMRKGWTRVSLRIGEVVTVSGILSKDAPFGAFARKVVKSDGSEVFKDATEADVQ